MWSYQQAAKSGNLADSPLNKIQHKFWVTKQAVTRKLNKDEDEHIVASDSELDAKLELFRSIQQTSGRLQRLLEIYQDRICWLAGEENALGRFLKEHGKSDKTKAGKMMIAAGKTMSYCGQQRLAIRVPLVRLYQEVETFQQRAIQDTLWTVERMEKERNEYRGALAWMKNVSTELDPDTYRQLEKFRKVQGHVKTSKARFDKLKLDVLQKVDLLAASRCNMFSYALILYQDTLVTFWDKTSKTMSHVNNGFKGYQYYEFNYIKDLAGHGKEEAEEEEKKKKVKPDAASFPTEGKMEEKKDKDNLFFFNETEFKDEKENSGVKGETSEQAGSLSNLLDLSHPQDDKLVDLSGDLPDDDDDVLLKIDSELADLQPGESDLLGRGARGQEDFFKEEGREESEVLLNQLLDTSNEASEGFTAEWEAAFKQEETLLGELSKEQEERRSSLTNQSFLPSNLFALGQLTAAGGVGGVPQQVSKAEEKSEWFQLFADLDPLANPDSVGRKEGWDGGC